MAQIPPHKRTIAQLSPNKPISDQLKTGFYMVVTDRPTDAINEENNTFTMQSTFFCLEPYSTCAKNVEGERYLQLHKSCGICWKCQDKLIETLATEDYKCFNLVHWGPDNEQHATVLGPLTLEQYKKCAIMIKNRYPWIDEYTTMYALDRDGSLTNI